MHIMKRMKPMMLLIALLVFHSGAWAQEVVDDRYSGSWFDPTHDGEGYVVEVLDDNRATVYWFTYDSEGNERW